MSKLEYVKYSKNDSNKLVPGERTKITTQSFEFTLKDNEYIIFYGVPIDEEMTIREDTAGYELIDVTATNLSGNALEKGAASAVLPVSYVSDSETSPGHYVVFTNEKEVLIETGISLDSLPYILILVGVAAVVLFLLIRKRKNYED